MNRLYPEGLQGKALYDYLILNKKSIIEKKKSFKAKSDNAGVFSYSIVNTKGAGFKAQGGVANEVEEGVVRVKVIMNTSMWFDSDYDVLMPNSWKKSIQENKRMIPHLHDHIFLTTAEVGDVVDIYSQDIPFRELGLDKDGTTQCLVFVTDIRKDYNPNIYNKYKNSRINQHSIGFYYVNIDLAVNDEDYEDAYKLWKSVIDDVINKEAAEEVGFMWVVREIKLIEGSAVLVGANEMTYTLDNDYNPTDNQPIIDDVITGSKSGLFEVSDVISKFDINDYF